MTVMHRVGYAIVKTLLVLVVLALPRAPLRHHEPSLTTVGIAVVVSSLAYALLQGSDPGYLTEALLREAMEQNQDDDHLRTTEKENDDIDDGINGIHNDKLQSPAKQAEKDYRLRRIQQIQAALERSARVESTEGEEEDGVDCIALEHQPLTQQLDSEPGQSLDAFCVDCSLFPPLRAHHCHACGRCVATFDHHCYLVGTCIGEENHARFWWFLLFQTLELLLGVLLITARFQPPKPKRSWVHANGWPLFLLLVLALLLLFVGSMLAFHTFLAMASMTTYEIGRGTDKIAYLQGFRECDLPFSRGLVSNLTVFCSPRRSLQWSGVVEDLPIENLGTRQHMRDGSRWLPMLWKPPAPILNRDSDNIWENLWENKYYSCC